MIECFFSILGKQGLSRSVHTSKRQIKEFLLDPAEHFTRYRFGIVTAKLHTQQKVGIINIVIAACRGGHFSGLLLWQTWRKF
jgi:hypothetical protein